MIPLAMSAPVKPRAFGNESLFVKGSVDDVLQSHPDPSALRHCLRHEDDEHVFFRVDPEGGPACTGPVHLADGSFRRAHAGFGPNRETQPKAEAGSGQEYGPGATPEPGPMWLEPI